MIKPEVVGSGPANRISISTHDFSKLPIEEPIFVFKTPHLNFQSQEKTFRSVKNNFGNLTKHSLIKSFVYTLHRYKRVTNLIRHCHHTFAHHRPAKPALFRHFSKVVQPDLIKIFPFTYFQRKHLRQLRPREGANKIIKRCHSSAA